MQRKLITTTNVIEHIDLALAQYNENCKGLFNRPGKVGRERRDALIKLKESLRYKTAQEAFALLYHFYEHENQNVRLINLLRHSMLLLIGVTVPEYTGNLSDYVNEMSMATDTLKDVGEELLHETGMIEANQNAMVMTRIRKTG